MDLLPLLLIFIFVFFCTLLFLRPDLTRDSTVVEDNSKNKYYIRAVRSLAILMVSILTVLLFTPWSTLYYSSIDKTKNILLGLVGLSLLLMTFINIMADFFLSKDER